MFDKVPVLEFLVLKGLETACMCNQDQTLIWTCVVGAHLQCVNNHYAKFEYKKIKTVGVTDYTNQTPPMHFGWKNFLSSTLEKNVKIIIKCAQNRWCTSSICEQSLCKV